MARGSSQNAAASVVAGGRGGAAGGGAAPRGGARRRLSSGGGSAGFGSGGSGNMLRFYTDDAPGLKITPTMVLVMSVCFIAFVTALHIAGKLYNKSPSSQ